MSNRVYGIDLSHHNYSTKVKMSDILYADGKRREFVILKASEGKTYKDFALRKWITEISSVDDTVIFGAYHYARPENNSWIDEANLFLSTIEPVISNGMLLALDWEGNALTKGTENWALNWLNYVYNKTGIRPLFYCQQSAVKNYPNIQKHNYGLWVARYNDVLGDISPWKYEAIWQYASTPYDLNVFNGTREQLKKYANLHTIACPHGHTDCPYITRS